MYGNLLANVDRLDVRIEVVDSFDKQLLRLVDRLDCVDFWCCQVVLVRSLRQELDLVDVDLVVIAADDEVVLLLCR